MYANQLSQSLGLLPLVANNQAEPISQDAAVTTETRVEDKHETKSTEPIEQHIDKNQFRLLVKMLQAINHSCQFDLLQNHHHHISYQHPKKTLVFKDISIADTHDVMNLSSLADLLAKPELKRAVWEKLKKL